MIIFQIDSDKLPNSADLKALVFPSTYSISVTDNDVRFVSREAFPDVSVPIGLVPLAFVMPAVQAELAKLGGAQQPAAAAAGSQPGAATPGQRPAGAQPPAGGTPGRGGFRGRRPGG